MEGGVPSIAKEALLEELEGGGARTAVVTPNRRLAQALAREYGDRQEARGLAAWETPDILPFSAFIVRLWEDALYSDRGATIPALLGEAQEQALWEECVRASGLANGLLSVSAAAASAREAWKLVHAWRLRAKLDAAATHEDARTFLDWAVRYEKATASKRHTDAARLPDVLKPLLARGGLRLPPAIVAFGFDLVTPQQHAFLDALAAAGVPVSMSRAAPKASRALRLAFSSAREEIAACARWARSRLEAGARRIGIVAPDIARVRSPLERALADVMVPGHRLPGAPQAAMPFEVSLGVALDQFPLVQEALRVLALCGPEIEYEAFSRTLRSPFIAGAESELSARACLDAELRRRANAKTSLAALRRLVAMPGVPRAPLLEARLVQLAEFQRRNALGARAPSAWAQAFLEALRIAGFPGERTLDSNEFQALSKWHEVVGEFGTLDRVSRRLSYREALRSLAEMAAATLFQPQGTDAPVQVLGVLESAGLEFDHLWVLGLTDEAWPLAERAHPLVPLRLQRQAGVPQADADASLEIDRRFTQGWLGAACEVVLSHARAESDRELFASPLITAVAEGSLDDLALAPQESVHEAIARAHALEAIEDRFAPPIAASAQPGGTALFKDQAACPFRGFARHRMASRALESPAPGLDARERGTLLHVALAAVWQALGDRAALLALDEVGRAEIIARAVDEAVARVRKRRPDALPARFGEIERARLVAHLGEWLAFEAAREDFSVVAAERKARIAFGGVEVEARLDRMDRLASGVHAVIDYKTGEARVAQWLGERLDEPQLPMYALGSGEDVGAVVFAHVKAGEFCFSGLARAENLLPGVTTIEKNRARRARAYRDWDALTKAWREDLEEIGSGYAKGDANVDPKDGAATCKLCDQRTFCRVSERLPLGPLEEGGGDER